MAGTANFTSETFALFLCEAGSKSALVLLIAWLFCRTLRATSAAMRHQIWYLGCVGALLVMVVTTTDPRFPLPLLPSRTKTGTAPSMSAVARTPGMPLSAAIEPLDDRAHGVLDSPSTNPEPTVAASMSVESQAAMAPRTAPPETPAEEPTESFSNTSAALPRSANSIVNPPLALILVWIVGFLVTLIPAIVAFVSQRTLLVKAKPIVDEACLKLLKECSLRIGVKPPIELLETARLISPLTVGVLRPLIVVPADWRSWSTERLRCVFMHELAHIHRRDVLRQAIARGAATTYWFNPLVWYALRRMRIERELACDDHVLATGEVASAYAQQLLDLARTYRPSRVPVGVAITRSSRLEERIMSLFDSNQSHRPASRRFLWASTTAAVCLVMMIALATVAEMRTVASEPSTDATATIPATAGKEPKPDVAAEKNDQAENKPDSPAASSAPKEKAIARTVRVRGTGGKPIKDAEIYWFSSRVHDLRPMKPQLLGTTNEIGQAQIVVPTNPATAEGLPASWEYSASIYIKAKGRGFVRGSYELLSPPRTFLESLTKAAATAGGEVLPPAGKPLQGRIVDIDGQPVAGATVQIRWFVDANDPAVVNDRSDDPDNPDPVWSSRVHNLINVIEPEPLRHLLPSAKTDADGRFELGDLGENRLVQLLVRGDQIASTEIIAFNGAENDVIVLQDRHFKDKSTKVFGRTFQQVAAPSKAVEGKVVDLETGQPIADAIVRAFAVHGQNLHSSREREEYATRTDQDGKYRLTGLPVGNGNELAVLTDGAIAYLPVGHRVDTSKDEPNTNHDFGLKRGIWAEGRVHDAESGQPLAGELTYYYFQNAEFESQVPGFRNAYIDGRYWTNRNGEFRVPVAPTRGILAFRYDGPGRNDEVMSRYPGGYGSHAIAGAEDHGGLVSFPTRPHYLTPSNYMRVAEVHPAAGQDTIQVDMSIKANKPVTVSVVDSQGKPVLGFEVYGAAERWGWQKKEGIDFTISDLKTQERRKIMVFDQARGLAGGLIIEGGSDKPQKVELQPAGRLAGRLLDEANEPITDASLFVKYEKLQKEDNAGIWANHPNKRANPTTIPIDKEGRFVVSGLIPGWKYSAYISAPRKLRGEMTSLVIGTAFDDATLEPGQQQDLGDLVIKSKPEQ